MSLLLLGTALAVAIGTVLYAVAKWYNLREGPSLLDKLNKQRALPLKDSPGVYRSGLIEDTDGPVSEFDPTVKTLYDVFMRGHSLSENGPCLGYRPGPKKPYQFITYAQILQLSRQFASALITKIGLKPGDDTRVALYGRNRQQWFISAFGCVQQSMVIVPLYDTLGPQAVTHIVQQADISLIITDNAAKAKKLLEREDLITLRDIIVIDGDDIEGLKENSRGIRIHTFQEILDEGESNPAPVHLPEPNNVYMLCYTSGTTGFPKGVILTHKNVLSSVSAYVLMFEKVSPEYLAPNQLYFSYLPLSHVYEQMGHWCMMCTGSALGYGTGDMASFSDDVLTLKPTILPAVPRILNKYYDVIHAQLAKGGIFKRWVYNFAYQRKRALLRQGVWCNDSIWDKLVFNKIQAHIGGRVLMITTGSAPVSVEVLETCRIVFGCLVFEGYGQTECTAVATLTWPGDYVGGDCGGPSTCTLIKLADVPELDYYAVDGKGEVMLKGPHCTSGYFKDPEKTSELYDEEGFIHTGDIGLMLPNGSLKIIDRKKHIFKLAQGEYVAPEKIENVYSRVPCVQQIYVDGNSLERFLVAIVVPEESEIKKWIRENLVANGKTYDQILQSKEVKNYVLSELSKIGKESKLNSIEQVKAVHLTSDAFSIQNGLLTPTLKAKRPQLRNYYKDTIAALYDAAK